MQYQGVLTKMQTEIGNPIQYYLVFENQFLNVNQIIGNTIEIQVKGYQCLHCGKAKKIFRQGNCYDCFTTSASVGDWVMHPELSTAHLGIEDRDLDYETKVQLQPHIVYFALSSELKVGVTRKTQVPTRWIDQGAVQAVAIVEVPNRYLAGIAEVALKNSYADKTNWRKMLTNQVPNIDLLEEKKQVFDKLPSEVQPYFLENATLLNLNYPVEEYPNKVTSISLENTPNFSGKIVGIKGQYLLFENGVVLNIRTFEGYVVAINI